MPDTTQRLLGFDFGLRHIGVASGQTFTKTAQALTSLRATNGQPDWKEIAALINTWKPNAIVVGLPLNMDDTEQALTKAAKTFANELNRRFNITVHLMDERLSSVAARELLFAKGGYRALNKKAIDSTAAQLILESWMTDYSL